MNIATAGHVDHGKTSLVRALTGIDTDRLPEEQQRGLSIDLGFAYVDWADRAGPAAARAAVSPGDAQGAADLAGLVGLIDVPGHVRYARNMLAGLSRIDLALLVVAADDGPMPQTREHLAILQLLGVTRAVVALTKVDRVAPERQAQAQAEVAQLLADTPFAGAPVFAVATPSGQGVPALRAHLVQCCRDQAAVQAGAAPAGQFRLAVDRSFAVAGAGRVVTGAVLSGQVRVGDAVLLSPQGLSARVRGLHAQHRPADVALAGQRCALNLAGLDLKQAPPERGDWIVAPAAHAPTQRLDAWLQVLPSEAKGLADRAGLQLHIGAAAVGVRLAVLAVQGGRSLAPGAAGWVQLVTDTPVAAAHGDRFILRDSAGQRTVGGGWVADPCGPARGRARPERLAMLQAVALPDAAEALRAALALSPAGLAFRPFAQARNLRPDEVQAVLAAAGPLKQLVIDDALQCLSATHWQALQARTLQALDDWHAEQPESLGPTLALLAQRVAPAPPAQHTAPAAAKGWPAWVRAAVDELAAQGQLRHAGLRLQRPGHQPRLADADAALLARVTDAITPAGLRPPIVRELALQLGVPPAELLDFSQRAAHIGLLVRVAPNRFYLPHTVPALAAVAQQLAAESPDGRFDTAAYRDRSGIGRNLSVEVLEFLDREGFTRREGERRRVLVLAGGAAC